MMSILKNFDVAIIKTPKEGIMGLNKDGKAIILRNGDMVSMSLLDKKFAEVMFMRGMLRPIATNDNIKPKDTITYKMRKRRREKKRDRDRTNGFRLDNWIKIKSSGGGNHEKG